MFTPSARLLAFRERIAEQRAQREAELAAREAAIIEGPSSVVNSVSAEDIGDGSGVGTGPARPSSTITNGFVFESGANTQDTGVNPAPAPVEEEEAVVEAPAAPAPAPEEVEVVQVAPEAPAAPVAGPSSSVVSASAEQIGGQDPVVVVEENLAENAEGASNVVIGEPTGEPTGNVVIENGFVVEQQISNVVEEEAVPGLVLEGDAGRDRLRGDDGDDVLNGNGGNDRLFGEDGDDIIAGGAGRDFLDGGDGNDTFIFNEGDGFDRIRNFDLRGDDKLQIDIDGIDSVDDFLNTLVSERDAGQAVSATFDFGGGDRLNILLDSVENLTAEDFIFG